MLLKQVGAMFRQLRRPSRNRKGALQSRSAAIRREVRSSNSERKKFHERSEEGLGVSKK